MSSKKLFGTVIKKNGLTVTVKVKRYVMVKKYRKQISRTKKFLAHDEKGQAKIGESVEIIETRPISKRKSWSVK